MNQFELRSIRELSIADVLEVSGDVRLFRVMHIDSGNRIGMSKIHVLSMDGKTRVTSSSVMRAAAQEERRLWEAVKGRHPGQLKHDAGAWSAWVCAERKLRRLTDEAKAADPAERVATKTVWG